MNDQKPETANSAADAQSLLNAGLAHCWLIHRYSKWTDIAKGALESAAGETIGYYIRQERRCEICGKVQLRDENVR